MLAEPRPQALDESSRRRQHLRFPVSWATEIRAGRSGSQAARIVNVSQGGVGVIADDMLPASCVLDLHMRLSGAANGGAPRVFVARAKVIHQVFAGGRTRAGLQFVDVAPDDARWLVESARRSS